MADTAPPAAAAIRVFTATDMTYPSAASSEPGLNPNHPSQSMKTPMTVNTMLCPGIARGLPASSYLPIRGPRALAPMNAATPPVRCTIPDPAKSE